MIASCDGQRSQAVIPISVVNWVMQDIVESFSGERGMVRWAEGWRVDYRVIFFLLREHKVTFEDFLQMRTW